MRCGVPFGAPLKIWATTDTTLSGTVWNGAAGRRPAAMRHYDRDATFTAIAALTP